MGGGRRGREEGGGRMEEGEGGGRREEEGFKQTRLCPPNRGTLFFRGEEEGSSR
jgi:hypothetical protein